MRTISEVGPAHGGWPLIALPAHDHQQRGEGGPTGGGKRLSPGHAAPHVPKLFGLHALEAKLRRPQFSQEFEQNGTPLAHSGVKLWVRC